MGRDKKIITIIVEATPYEWQKDVITYEEVITLEESNYNPNITYSVGYERGQGNKPEGTMSPGESLKVKEGMVFYVSETSQS